MQSSVDEHFDYPRTPVSIVSLPDSASEVSALRGLLENLGCVVTVHWTGTPKDFLKVLTQGGNAPRYLLICGYGDSDKGFYFGEYGSAIDTSMLQDKYLPAEVIAHVVNLPGCTVIASACGAGSEAMGKAFLGAGKVEAYIGCRDYPDSNAMLVFLANFFYTLLGKKCSVREAWYTAIKITDNEDINQISLFHADGKEERYEA